MNFTREIDYSTITVPMHNRQELIDLMGKLGYNFVRERCVGDESISMVFYKIISITKEEK